MNRFMPAALLGALAATLLGPSPASARQVPTSVEDLRRAGPRGREEAGARRAPER